MTEAKSTAAPSEVKPKRIGWIQRLLQWMRQSPGELLQKLRKLSGEKPAKEASPETASTQAGVQSPAKVTTVQHEPIETATGSSSPASATQPAHPPARTPVPAPTSAPVRTTAPPPPPARPVVSKPPRNKWTSHGVKPMRRPTSFSSEVMVKGGVPKVLVSELAYDKIMAVEDRAPDEVGWLGTAMQLDDGTFLIEDIFILEQEVTGTVTEITNAGLAKFMRRIMSQPNGAEIWNKIQYWGHSHDDMGVSPSGQDNNQMDLFAKSGHSWFIRSICNSKGDMKIDLYFFNEEEVWIIFPNIEWEVVQQVDASVRAQVDAEFEANVRTRGSWTSFRSSPPPQASTLSVSEPSPLAAGPALVATPDLAPTAPATSTTPPPPLPTLPREEPAGDGAPGN